MPRRRPWFKLSATFFSESRIRLAGCAAVYPWIIAKLKQANGAADDDDLNAECCALDLGLPAEIVRTQIGNMIRNGLLRKGSDGLWRDPFWEESQSDSASTGRKRKGNDGASFPAPRGETNAEDHSWPPYRHAADSGAPLSQPPESIGETGTPAETARENSRGSLTRARGEVRVESREKRKEISPEEVALGSKVSCAEKPDAKPPEATGGIWFKNIIVESTGTQLPTYRNDSEGKRVWNVGALMHVFQRLWPSDPSCDPGGKGNRTLWRFAMELTEKHHPDIIDAAVAKIAPHPALLEPERWNRPYMLKALIEQPPPTPQQQARSGSRSSQPRGDVRAEAQAAQLAKYRSQAEGRTDDGELHELAKDYLAANEIPSEQFRVLLTDFYRRKGWPLPPLFAPPGAV